MESRLEDFQVARGGRPPCWVPCLNLGSPTKAVKVRRVCQTSVELGNAWQCCSPKLITNPPSGASTGIWPVVLSELSGSCIALQAVGRFGCC